MLSNLAFVVSIFASFSVFAPEIFAQQPQPANAALRFSCEELIRWADPGRAQVKVEVSNVNRLSETTKQIMLTSTLTQEPGEFVEVVPAFQYRLTDFPDKWLAVKCPEDKIFLKVSELAWVNHEAKIVVDSSSPTGVSALLLIQLEPGTYRINALVKNFNGTATIADVTENFSEGQTTTVVLKQPSRLDGVWRALWSLEGALGTAVIALLTILVSVAGDKIKLLFGKLLDVMGKFFGGRLAERRFLKRYLENLIYSHKYLNVIGLNTAGISRPLLEDVFVSLRIVHRTAYETTTQTADQRAAIPFNAAFRSYRHMALLGGPGAGKTTTLSYALLMFAQDFAKQRFGIDEKLLPIYVPLRRLSNSTRSIIEDVTDKNTQILSAEILKEYPPNYFERRLKQGSCLILLDGLDEVLDERSHRQIAGRINDLLAAYPQNRFLVTCRTAGWKDLLSGEFTVLSAQDFDRDDIQRFVVGWHKAVITQSELSRTRLEHPDPKKFNVEWTKRQESIKNVVDNKSRDLIRAINTNNRILAIAVNPMLLSLISLVHLNRQILPRGRTLLYSQCLELLIDSWDRTRDIMLPGPGVAANQKEAVLREIAFDFQTKGREEDSRSNLEQLIASIASRLGISTPAKDLLEDIETRSGLLTERSLDVFGFTHLTLQEYLVAKHIHLNRNHYDLLSANFDNQRWHEVILLYTGLVDDATELIRGVVASESPYRQRLAGYCVGDAERCDGELAQKVIDELSKEVPKDTEDANALVDVIAAIAADFHGEPNSIKEKLSARLISNATDQGAPNRALAIAAIGRARITRGLPALLSLLDSEDLPVRVNAYLAVVQFGDLALPAIDQFLKQEPGIVSILAIIRILVAINTGPAARMLLTLSESDPTSYSEISEQIAKMVANPLVEADLLGLETTELPTGFRNLPIDNNGWPLKSAKTGFLVLDSLMRRVVKSLIDAGTGAPSFLESKLSGTSFKILLPAFLAYLKSPRRARLTKNKVYSSDVAIFGELGFDRTDPNKLYHLLDQIETFDMPLEFALQSVASGNESGLPSAPRRDLFLNYLSNAGFITVYWLLVFHGVTAALYIYDFDLTRRTMTLRATAFLSVHLLGWLMCAVLIVLTKQKLKTSILSRKFFSIVMNPIGGFLKVLPYVGKYRPTIKLIALQLSVVFLTGCPLYVYMLWTDELPWNFRRTWAITLPLFFIPLSIYYWKHRVFTRNPVLELVSMHPEGRKLIGDIG